VHNYSPICITCNKGRQLLENPYFSTYFCHRQTKMSTKDTKKIVENLVDMWIKKTN